MSIRRSAFQAALAVVAFQFVVASAFVFPIGDDLDFASAARESGVWVAWRQQYLTWNGRFASNLLALAIPSTLTAYRLTIAFFMLALLVATALLVASLSAGRLNRRDVATTALVVVGLYFSRMPSIGEGTYWYTSAVTYHVAMVLATVQLALAARAAEGGVLFLPAAALLFIVCGFNEILPPMMALLYAVLAVFAPIDRRKRARFAVLCAVAVAGGLVVLLSPGNAARLSAYTGARHLGPSVAMTGLQTVRFLSDWATDGAVLLATALWMATSARVLPQFDSKHARTLALLCAAGLLLVVPIAAFPAYWATGSLGQHRTLNSAFFVFLLLWFAAAGFWASSSRTAAAITSTIDPLKVPLAAALLAALAFTRNGYAIGEDFATGRFTRFQREMRARDDRLERCRIDSAPLCVIDPIEDLPRSLFIVEVSNDPHDWVNVAYARRYGLRQVQLQHVRH